MIIVNIIGGLGNQLFQYAFGKYLETSTGDIIKFGINTDLVANNFTTRSLDIEKFNVGLDTASDSEIREFVKFRTGYFWRIERKLTQIFPSFNSHYVVQKNAHALIKSIKNPAYYDGYWQCYQYVDHVSNILKKEIVPSEDFFNKHADLLHDFKNEDSVAIHIRRGDYINIKVNAELYEVCDFEYYDNACILILEKYPKATFYIFTQDMEWVKEYFHGEHFKFMEGNSAIDDMLLMSFCKHNIIANSTFSWWSAWLNTFSDKIVIAPKKWYKGELNNSTDKLISPQWIRI